MMDMNKKQQIKILFLLLAILFTIWVLFLLKKYSELQELRHFDPLWLIHGLFPIYFILLGIYTIIFIYLLYKKCDSKEIHILFLSQLSLIIYGTPYFISTYARFPDTISTVKNIMNLNTIFLTQPQSYPANYPSSYIFFKVVLLATNIDLLYFARIIFAPFCLISIIILWYLILRRLIKTTVAFICSILIIPTPINEISITPNSYAILLILIILFLFSIQREQSSLKTNNSTKLKQQFISGISQKNSRTHSKQQIIITLFVFIIIGILVLAHPINALILLVILLTLFFSDIAFSTQNFKISIKVLAFLYILWIWWLVKITEIGDSLLHTLYRMISSEISRVDIGVKYSLGKTGFLYSYIDQLAAMKYIFYGLIALFLLILLVLNMVYKKKNNSFFQFPITFIIIAGIFILITIVNLMTGLNDIQNVISRTLNFGMYALCIFIGCSFFLIIELNSNFIKILNGLLALLIIVSLMSYPIYSFARDSYINFPPSEGAGRNFIDKYCIQNTSLYLIRNKASQFYSYLYNQTSYNDLIYGSNQFSKEGKIYNNNWYSLDLRS